VECVTYIESIQGVFSNPSLSARFLNKELPASNHRIRRKPAGPGPARFWERTGDETFLTVFRERPHGHNRVILNGFHVPALRDRNRGMPQDGLNGRVVDAQAIQVGSQSAPESVPLGKGSFTLIIMGFAPVLRFWFAAHGAAIRRGRICRHVSTSRLIGRPTEWQRSGHSPTSTEFPKSIKSLG
jgi:hypothetical protein